MIMAEGALEKLNILLVEDDDDDVILFEDYLEEGLPGYQHELIHASTPEEAQRYFTNRNIDIAIFDYMLGPTTGLELIREARLLGFGFPVILLTGQGDEETAVAALKAGADDYLSKGNLTPELLAGAIRHALDLHKTREASRVAQEELVREKEFITAVFKNSFDGIAVAGRDGELKLMSPGMERLFGYQAAELPDVATWLEMISMDGESKASGLASWEKDVESEKPRARVLQFRHKNGQIRWCRLQLAHMPRGDIVINGQDITASREAEAAIRESEERFRLLAETIQDVFWMSKPGVTEMIYVSPAYEKVWGRSREELYRRPHSFLEAVVPEDRDRLDGHFDEHAQGKWDHEYRIMRPDGKIRWIEDKGFPVLDEGGGLKMMVGIAIDITGRKQLEEKLTRLATTDSLTGASNRMDFLEKAGTEFNRARRYGLDMALFMIDIDHFKNVNDTYGHAAGDEVLRAMVVEMDKKLRDTDVLSRIGGEEFAAMLIEADQDRALAAAERLRAGVAALKVGKAGIRFTISIGVAILSSKDKDLDAIMRRADKALYRAKDAGRNQVVLG